MKTKEDEMIYIIKDFLECCRFSCGMLFAGMTIIILLAALLIISIEYGKDLWQAIKDD